jgi:hypothetical protein
VLQKPAAVARPADASGERLKASQLLTTPPGWVEPARHLTSCRAVLSAVFVNDPDSGGEHLIVATRCWSSRFPIPLVLMPLSWFGALVGVAPAHGNGGYCPHGHHLTGLRGVSIRYASARLSRAQLVRGLLAASLASSFFPISLAVPLPVVRRNIARTVASVRATLPRALLVIAAEVSAVYKYGARRIQ